MEIGGDDHMSKEARAARPPVADVFREAPFRLQPVQEQQGDGLTLDGFGAVFGRETIIDSWEGKFRERIAPGSMKKSFRENPPKIQFDHGRHPGIGSIPIAKLERIVEESHPELAPDGGAHITARMFTDPLFGAVREAITAGAIDGMSFRFSVIRETWERADGRQLTEDREIYDELQRSVINNLPNEELPLRTLKELRVPEIGPVVWPAYTDTSVGLRSRVINLARLVDRDPEELTLLGRALLMMQPPSTIHSDAPHLTEPAAEVHAETSQDDAPPVTDDSANQHPSTSDEPRATVAGKHPPKPPLTQRKPLKRGRRPVDIMVRTAREVSLRIAQEQKNVS